MGLGKYSYRIYNRSMNPEEKKEYDEDPMFIPYTLYSNMAEVPLVLNHSGKISRKSS